VGPSSSKQGSCLGHAELFHSVRFFNGIVIIDFDVGI
jgi:hypothetical protein